MAVSEPDLVYMKGDLVQTVPKKAPKPKAQSNDPVRPVKVNRMGYTVQVGAYSIAGNAEKMLSALDAYDYDPYLYKDSTGLFKVRFGNFDSHNGAESRALALKTRGIIDDFYILSPNDYTAAVNTSAEKPNSLRAGIVKSAYSYIGVPYIWGGSSRKGVDCSGLTQAVYSLNGLSIPRNSREQYSKGASVSRGNMQPGDLVFFATAGRGSVSHVGVYIGNNSFIHAPSKGKRVTSASLLDPYFSKVFVGARSYL
jgi:hypothetical protein